MSEIAATEDCIIIFRPLYNEAAGAWETRDLNVDVSCLGSASAALGELLDTVRHLRTEWQDVSECGYESLCREQAVRLFQFVVQNPLLQREIESDQIRDSLEILQPYYVDDVQLPCLIMSVPVWHSGIHPEKMKKIAEAAASKDMAGDGNDLPLSRVFLATAGHKAPALLSSMVEGMMTEVSGKFKPFQLDEKYFVKVGMFLTLTESMQMLFGDNEALNKAVDLFSWLKRCPKSCRAPEKKPEPKPHPA